MFRLSLGFGDKHRVLNLGLLAIAFAPRSPWLKRGRAKVFRPDWGMGIALVVMGA